MLKVDKNVVFIFILFEYTSLPILKAPHCVEKVMYIHAFIISLALSRVPTILECS